MTEPQRDSARTTPPSDDTDRATRIEELLVSGLDHYFAADYEQAINIWTRVVFLEREHDRARAYIERARSAIAERQRESEELLHRGVDAYKSGDVANARDLGFPIEESRSLLGLWQDRHRSSADVKALAISRADELGRKAASLEAMRRALMNLAESCSGDERPDCPIIACLAREM